MGRSPRSPRSPSTSHSPSSPRSPNNPPDSDPPTTEDEGTLIIRNSADNTRGDLAINGFHQTGKTTILDIAVIHNESESYIRKNLSAKKVLEKHEKAKKRKHLNNCLQNRRNFVPFVMSTDGMMAPEAKAFVKLLARKLADKWQAP